MTIYTEGDAGALVSLHPGESFDVRLPENPTTGYRWRIAEWDAAQLEVIRDEFRAPSTPVPGAGGEHDWVFRARASGTSLLRIVYARGWQSASPARTFTLNISIS